MSDGNEEAIKRALESGRSHEDIAKDLADDGLLNNSHLLGSTERLIESNGETQDVIERATETAQKLQKLLTAIIPILVLIAGSGLEMGGIIDITPAGGGDDDWAWEDDEYNYPEPVRYGCTDYDAENYDEYAEEDDGTCEYEEEVWGCTNDAASNYDPDATHDDGSCEPAPQPPRRGCTDDTAENYDDEAEEDDGSCTYPEPEPCEPEYYDYYVSYGDANNTTIEFTYDVDISCDETQGVTVQFLAYVNGSGHGEAPYNYTIDEFNTTYQDWDSRTVMLGNFTNGSYDIYAYLINEHGDMMKESKWFNVQLKARDE